MSAESLQRIVILGGGFGGLYTALRLEKALAREADLDVTLVNRENFFLFTPMLHEVAASDLEMTHIVNPIRKLLRRTRFVEGHVESVDLRARRVVVSHGGEHHHHDLPYDHLVIALGSVTNFYRLPGVEERALTMKSLGINFSGFLAWWMWRTIYLSKLPRFEKRVRVALDWLLDLLFSKDLVQFQTGRAPAMSHAENGSHPAESVAGRV